MATVWSMRGKRHAFATGPSPEPSVDHGNGRNWFCFFLDLKDRSETSSGSSHVRGLALVETVCHEQNLACIGVEAKIGLQGFG